MASSSPSELMEMPHDNPNDMSRSLAAFDQNNTLVMVVELSKKSWLVAGLIPGVERQPKKKMEPDAEDLLRLLGRWRDEAVKGGCPITRIAVAYEAGRDGYWRAFLLSPSLASSQETGRAVAAVTLLSHGKVLRAHQLD